jgi:hypothetical protein
MHSKIKILFYWGNLQMKKLIAFLKSLFCKSQDHTEDVKPVDPETEIRSEENVVILDNVNTVIDECKCDKNCECCDCNEESCEEDNTCEECDCTKEACEGCECECCDCECTEESCNEDCDVAETCDDPEVIVKEELERWGIPASNLNYDCIVAMINISSANSYDDIASVLAPAMDRNKASISTSLKALVNKANFANSIFYSIKDIDNTQDFKCVIFDIYTWIKSL